MNPLMEGPSLFANGKFSIQHGDTIYSPDDWGIDGGSLCTFRDVEKNGIEYRKLYYPLMSQVTLIARKISDMTDKEVRGLPDVREDLTERECQFHRNRLIGLSEEDIIPMKCFLYLRSIGVYPFDQKDFDDGTVININEVK